MFFLYVKEGKRIFKAIDVFGRFVSYLKTDAEGHFCVMFHNIP